MSKRGPFFRVRASLLSCGVVLCILPPNASALLPVRSLAEIRQQNVVMQKWDLSCGAAALATLLTYDLGDPVTERSAAEGMLRRNDPLTIRVQGGFSLLDLQEYAQRRGYDADGYGEVSSDSLAGMLPAIVPIRIHGYNHFVVARAIRDGNIHFADPAYGNRRMTLAAFERAWPSRVAFVVSRPAR